MTINLTKTDVEESDLEEPGLDTRRLTTLMPRSLYEDLRVEADAARLLMGEHVRNILREHLAMTYCEECGVPVPGASLYCPYCGVEFEEEEDAEDEASEKED